MLVSCDCPTSRKRYRLICAWRWTSPSLVTGESRLTVWTPERPRETHLCCLLAGMREERRAESRLHATLGKAHPATVSSPAELNQLRSQMDPDLVSTFAASEHAGKTVTWQILAVIDSCYQQVPGTVLFQQFRGTKWTSVLLVASPGLPGQPSFCAPPGRTCKSSSWRRTGSAPDCGQTFVGIWPGHPVSSERACSAQRTHVDGSECGVCGLYGRPEMIPG